MSNHEDKSETAKNLDSNLLEFLKEHQEMRNLRILKIFYNFYMQSKSNNSMKFNDYVRDLESTAKEYEEFEEVTRNLIMRMNLLKQEQSKKITSFDEDQVENIFKNSEAKEHLYNLIEKDKNKSDTIADLEFKLESTKKELSIMQIDCKKIEEQRDIIRNQKNDLEVECWALEAEKLANDRRDTSINFEQTMNMSYASSFASQPPPPSVLNDIPTIEELLASE